MYEETKIKKVVKIKNFIKSLEKYCIKDIECTGHTFFRLSERQRKIYTCDELRRILTKEKPFLVGIQHNEKYAIFYKYEGKNLKMIVFFDDTKIKIVTFYFIEGWQIPKI